MHRAMKCLMITIIACVGVHTAKSLAHETTASSDRDTKEIYVAFLTQWMGKGETPINVANTVTQPTQEDIEQYIECASGGRGRNTHWNTSTADTDLKSTLAALPRVKLVNPKHWRATDPGRLIASGRSVDAAVAAGFAKGLMTISAISFNDAHDTAMLSYSFVCGSLCGNGGTVMFKKTSKGWVQSIQRCGGWMS